MFGVATISLLVGGVGIMNIMLVSVTERTREIGVRKAVGARRSYIMLQFLIEAVVLSCVGGAIGVGLGFGVALLINAVSPVPAAVRWWSVWLGLGFAAAVGIIFGLFPARRAAKKIPSSPCVMSNKPTKEDRRRLRRVRMRASFESLKMGLDSIRANKLRSILTCLGIIIGVATVIAMMGIVRGIDGIMTSELNRIGANSFFLKKYPSINVSFDWRKFRKRKDMTMADVRALRAQCPSVELVSPTVVYWNEIVRSKHDKTDPNVMLVGAESVYPRIGGIYVEEGRNFTSLEDTSPRRVAVLGWDVVEKLFPYGSPIGEYVRAGGFRLRVIGILERRGAIFGQSQDAIIVMPIQTVIKRHPLEDNLEISIKARPDVPIAQAMDEVRSVMRVRHKLKITDEDDFELETRESITKAWSNMTGSVFAAAIGIAMISLLVGGVGIMNIMLVSVKERTREIGVRKALGARPKDIKRQFLIEAMAVSFLGGLIGTGLGVGALQLFDKLSGVLPVEVTPFAVGLALSFSILVGIFFGVYPAGKAAKLDPIEALRYE
ncbi:MAG: ABC transporter permease [Deltaproteobacteria bacterium]|nr:ABC transporter permease [Deltaproteobacteria bacterium]